MAEANEGGPMVISRRAILAGLALTVATVGELCAADASRVALGGYDPVNYFAEGKPKKGVEQFSAIFEDATYWFKNAAHRQMFSTNPEKYAPQFSGFCAIDLSRGLKTEPDPEAWTIADGRLYVFGKKRGPGLFAQDGSA